MSRTFSVNIWIREKIMIRKKRIQTLKCKNLDVGESRSPRPFFSFHFFGQVDNKESKNKYRSIAV